MICNFMSIFIKTQVAFLLENCYTRLLSLNIYIFCTFYLFYFYTDDKYYGSQSERIVLPTAPRTARGPAIDPERIPKSPPFTAYIANLPFEVEDEEIHRFFNGCKVLFF